MQTSSQNVASTAPSLAAKIGAASLFALAGILTLLFMRVNPPGWVWALRFIALAAGAAVATILIVRENIRERQGLPVDRDTIPFDLWTIGHTLAGVVFGAWGLPGLLLLIFAVVWEFFEAWVPGFGEGETFANRTVDIAVAVVGWIITAGIIALTTHTPMPWIIPDSFSPIRDAWLHLF